MITFVPRTCFQQVCSSGAAPIEKTKAFAALARINTLSMIAYAGSGHIGSSFSALDIMSWIHMNEMRISAESSDVFFSSKGHDVPGLYSVLIGLGLIEETKRTTLRKLGGLPGHPDIKATPALHTNTGSLGMGISKAKGMAIADHIQGKKRRIFVLTGDGELQEGQIWESLATAVHRKLGSITVVVDHNKIQSDTYVSDTSNLGDLEGKFSAFGWHIQRIEGHDFDALEKACANARERVEQPSVIISDTVKGRGVSFMEHTAMDGKWYGYHSGAPSVDDYDKGVKELCENASTLFKDVTRSDLSFDKVERPVKSAPQSSLHKLVVAYGDELLSQAKQDRSIVALDADLVLDTGLIPFQEKLPERFIECGIAEQDMVSQASGLALSGLVPVVHSFACFLTPRANEQIYNTSSERKKVIYAGSLAGVVPAGPGHSHQSVRDIAMMGSIPDLYCFEPCCEEEARFAIRWALRDNDKSTYIRLCSIPVESPYQSIVNPDFKVGQGVRLRPGDDVVLIAYGPVLLKEAMRAAELLEVETISAGVINLPWLNIVDADWLSQELSGCKAIVTLDNHLIAGGQGERVISALAKGGHLSGRKVISLGLTEVPECGTNEEVLAHHGLDSISIAKTIQATL